MKRQTRAFLLNAATGIAIAAAAALVLMPATASAAPANTTTASNVRAEPSTSARIVDTLVKGEAIEVHNCTTSWCYIQSRDGYGYLSRSLITGLQGVTVPQGRPGQPDVNFGFTIEGPEGNSLSFGFNTPEPPRDPRPPVGPRPPVFVDDEACFYARSQYRGESFCVSAGDYIPDLGGWQGEISSIENNAGLDVTICSRTGLRGNCRTYTTSARSLGSFDNNVYSLSVD